LTETVRIRGRSTARVPGGFPALCGEVDVDPSDNPAAARDTKPGPDAPPLAPASARCRFAPRARRAAGARHERPIVDGIVVASGRGKRALCGAVPPALSPLRVPRCPAPPVDIRHHSEGCRCGVMSRTKIRGCQARVSTMGHHQLSQRFVLVSRFPSAPRTGLGVRALIRSELAAVMSSAVGR
jgi:hypothetical protein